MSPVIDQAVTWRKVEERLAVETDPVLRHNLEILLDHMKSESAGDVDGLLQHAGLVYVWDGGFRHPAYVGWIGVAGPVARQRAASRRFKGRLRRQGRCFRVGNGPRFARAKAASRRQTRFIADQDAAASPCFAPRSGPCRRAKASRPLPAEGRPCRREASALPWPREASASWVGLSITLN